MSATLNNELKEHFKGLSKNRKVIEVYRYIKNGVLCTPQELSETFGVSKDTITDYIKELFEVWNVDIEYNSQIEKYEILNDSKELSLKKAASSLTPGQIVTIIFALNNNNIFLNEEIEMIRMKLLRHLRKSEEEIVKKYIDKKTTESICLKGKDKFIESFNIIRKAIIDRESVDIKLKNIDGKKITIDPIKIEYKNGNYYLIGKEDNLHFIYANIKDIFKVEISNNKNFRFITSKDMDNINRFYGIDEEKTIKVRIKLFDEGRELFKLRRPLIGLKLWESTDKYDILEFTCNGLEGVKAWILGFGEYIDVIAPIELKDSIENEFEDVYNLYCSLEEEINE